MGKSKGLATLLFLCLIYVLTGPPREGKTFYATFKALQILKKGKEKVFSNYPIIYQLDLTKKQKLYNFYVGSYNFFSGPVLGSTTKKQKIQKRILSSIPWTKALMKDTLYDCSIFIDEAYDDYFSREWKDFEKEQLEWFATNGHNLLDVWIIAQNSAFVDVNIRRLTNYFIKMRKQYVFANIGFLWFRAEIFLSESEMTMNNRKMDLSYSKDRLTMRNDVKTAYDTHYFRDTKAEKLYSTWYDILKIVPSRKWSFNYGKIILVSGIFAAIIIFLYIMLKIFII